MRKGKIIRKLGDGKRDQTEATRKLIRSSASGEERIREKSGGNEGHVGAVQEEMRGKLKHESYLCTIISRGRGMTRCHPSARLTSLITPRLGFRHRTKAMFLPAVDAPRVGSTKGRVGSGT